MQTFIQFLESFGSLSAGGVVVKDGKILIREPTNHFGGYIWTFPKGKVDQNESVEQTAIREVLEETGVKAKIISKLPKDFIGDTSTTVFFLMQFVQDTGKFDWETSAIHWATPEEAQNMLNRQRDLDVLDTLLSSFPHLFKPDK